MDAVPVKVDGRNAAAKRPKTAWALFLRDFRKNAVSEFEGRSGIGKFNNLQKAASAKWKEMSDSEKAPWVQLEETCNKQYVDSLLARKIDAPAMPVQPTKQRGNSNRGYRRAFQSFVNEHRQRNPLYWSLYSFNEAQRQLSAAWNAIPDSEKQGWASVSVGGIPPGGAPPDGSNDAARDGANLGHKNAFPVSTGATELGTSAECRPVVVAPNTSPTMFFREDAHAIGSNALIPAGHPTSPSKKRKLATKDSIKSLDCSFEYPHGEINFADSTNFGYFDSGATNFQAPQGAPFSYLSDRYDGPFTESSTPRDNFPMYDPYFPSHNTYYEGDQFAQPNRIEKTSSREEQESVS